MRRLPHAKKEGQRKTAALLSVKVKNLQRGTVDAMDLGGATECINCKLYGNSLGKRQAIIVQCSHAGSIGLPEMP